MLQNQITSVKGLNFLLELIQQNLSCCDFIQRSLRFLASFEFIQLSDWDTLFQTWSEVCYWDFQTVWVETFGILVWNCLIWRYWRKDFTNQVYYHKQWNIETFLLINPYLFSFFCDSKQFYIVSNSFILHSFKKPGLTDEFLTLFLENKKHCS